MGLLAWIDNTYCKGDRMRMKKRLCVLLCIALIMGILSGCGNKGGNESANTNQKNVPDSTETTTEGKTEETGKAEQIIVKFGLGPLEEDTEAIWDDYNKTVDKFKETHPNVQVENARYDYNVDTFVPLAESGNLPTVFGTWFSEPQKLIANGYAADITDILAKRGWLDKMNESIRGILSDKDGRVYGIPASGYALGLMQNVELFKAAGLVDGNGAPLIPATWQEVAEFGKKIKDTTGKSGICILAQDNGAGWHFSNIAWGFGATLTVDNGDGTYTAAVNTNEAIEAMEYVKSLKWEYDVLTEDPLSENGGTGFAQLASGNAAMFIGASDGLPQLVNNGAKLGEFAICGLPAGPKGQYSLFGGTPYMFSPDATEAEINAALDFLTLRGIGPEVNEEAIAAAVKITVESGFPAVPGFALWDSEELAAAQNKIIKENSNMDPALYENYFSTTVKEGNLHLEEAGATQDLYAELTKVIQAVLTDKNADVASLMTTANKNYQTILDNLK